MSGSPIPFKLVLLGEGRVGKTSLCIRLLENRFASNQKSTIQATYNEFRTSIDGTSVKLIVWDTAGQEKFHALGPIYYRDAAGAMLVYDITDRDSFKKVRHWVKELRKIVGKEIVLVIAGNKSDLEKHRQVNEKEALQYAQEMGATHLYTSAKTGKGVKQAFFTMGQQMLRIFKKKNRSGQSSSRSFVDIANDVEQNNGGCCK